MKGLVYMYTSIMLYLSDDISLYLFNSPKLTFFFLLPKARKPVFQVRAPLPGKGEFPNLEY